MRAGGVGVDGCGGGSGGVERGPEGFGVVGVLVLEPEAGGGVRGGEVVGVVGVGAEWAAEGEDGCAQENG